MLILNLEPDIDIDASASSGHGSILDFMASKVPP